MISQKTLSLITLLIITAATAKAQGNAPSGSGSSSDPYIINDKQNLLYLSENSNADWSAYYKQINNITFDAADFQTGGDFYNNGDGFSPIGSSSTNFSGSYDGQGNIINKLFIDRSNIALNGFFGSIGSNGEVMCLGVTNVDLTGENQMGGLAGRNNGTIENSFTSGVVDGRERTGGLVGHNEGQGSIINSYSSAEVISNHEKIGGLVGDNSNATIKKSYSNGVVDQASTGSDVGGLTGREDGGDAINEDSFWDTDASGQTSSGGGTGKTTIEMNDVATFTDEANTTGLASSWDFINDPNDDTNTSDHWNISSSSNSAYPFLTTCSLSDLALPVTWLSFIGERVSRKEVELKWVTASEQNNHIFEIQRSIDGDNFDSIGSVKGNGNSTEIVEYEHTDYKAPINTIYYRLKQIDYDGAHEFFEIIAVQQKNELQENEFSIYPNPFSENFTIQLPSSEGSMNIVVYDNTEKIIFSKEVNDVNSLIINTSNWADGFYTITCQSPYNLTMRPLIKQ